MNVLVFDVETVPDVALGRRLYNLDGVPDADVAEQLFMRRRQQTDGQTDFLRHHLHRIVAISVLLNTRGKLSIWSLGDVDSPEQELIRRFFEGIERYSPMLVSWNGKGFDLPVLHYRSLLHGVSAPRYWETGEEDQSFRWNNYLSRYHERHTDLMDVLSGYEYRAAAPLDEIAVMIGLPGKMGMQGGAVWKRFQAGEIEAIRDYCETDVLNTYLIFLRFQLMRGRLSPGSYEEECARVKAMLQSEQKAHMLAYLRAWEA
jgi:3'-5' exonuclease